MPIYVATFTVTGYSNFPTDMLRYDACYPDTTEDAINLSEACKARFLESKEPVEITLRALRLTKHAAISTDRWLSFGWRVIKSNLMRI